MDADAAADGAPVGALSRRGVEETGEPDQGGGDFAAVGEDDVQGVGSEGYFRGEGFGFNR